MIQQLREWRNEKRKGLQLTITAYITPPAQSETPSRITTTSRQLAQLPARRALLEGDDNLATDIVEAWTCKTTTCKRYSSICW